jgi:hypothetical protein
MSRRKSARSTIHTLDNRLTHRPTSDPLRTYEQFGRIAILEGGLAGLPFVDVNVLANLAQQQLDSGYTENAANLLRAAEHLSFAALAPTHFTPHIPAELKAAAAGELDRLTALAQQRWSESEDAVNREIIESIFESAILEARVAFDRCAYRRSLQLARAAEALSHVTDGLPTTLPSERALIRSLAS